MYITILRFVSVEVANVKPVYPIWKTLLLHACEIFIRVGAVIVFTVYNTMTNACIMCIPLSAKLAEMDYSVPLILGVDVKFLDENALSYAS
jgi:hypothetical protein